MFEKGVQERERESAGRGRENREALFLGEGES